MPLTGNPLFPSARDNKKQINMKLQLLRGHYSRPEAIDLLTRLVQAQIYYHEAKIGNSDSEEDIKMRERSIRQLQRDLHEAKMAIFAGGKSCLLESAINLEVKQPAVQMN